MKFYLILMLLILLSLISCKPAANDEFAKCLTENGMTFYGTFWCGHCSAMKKKFGDSMNYIVYVECDPRGENAQPETCDKAGVEAYPTFTFADGTVLQGERDFQDFAALTGCELPS